LVRWVGSYELIEKYRKSYETRNPPLLTISALSAIYADNVEYGIYYLVPARVSEIHPKDNQLYGNGLSLALYLRHGNQSILIPGDITPDVFAEVIEGGKYVQKRYTYFDKKPAGTPENLHKENGGQPTLQSLLSERGLSILVAPHHGLESCFCPYLFEVIKDKKTRLNVISEKRHRSDGDGQVAAQYQSSDYAFGLQVDSGNGSEDHYSVSTRNGQHILVVFKGTNALPSVYLRADAEDLLDIVP